MSFIIKIFFAALVFIFAGSVSLIAMKDVEIQKETITKTIPTQNLQ